MENCPGSTTKSTCSKLKSHKVPARLSIDTLFPTEILYVFFVITLRVMTFSLNASGYVTIIVLRSLEVTRCKTSVRERIYVLSGFSGS